LAIFAMIARLQPSDVDLAAMKHPPTTHDLASRLAAGSAPKPAGDHFGDPAAACAPGRDTPPPNDAADFNGKWWQFATTSDTPTGDRDVLHSRSFGQDKSRTAR
jgi:hypothetical protein